MTWMGAARAVRGKLHTVAAGDLRRARWFFAASLGLAAAAFGLFVASEGAPEPSTYYRFRLVAGASAGGALALAPYAVTRALTAGRFVRAASVAAVGCGLGVVGFAWAYPYRWNVGGPADLTLEVTTVYAVSLAALFVVLWLVTVGRVYAAFAPATDEAGPRTTFERAFSDHDPGTDPGFNWVGDREN